MKKNVLFDPSLATDNLGDYIIARSIKNILRDIFAEDYVFDIPMHDGIGYEARKQLKSADHIIVGGTNLLTSHWWWYRQWKLSYMDVLRIKNCILMGVGWHKYQRLPDIITELVYKKILSKNYIHSVRDFYTENQLKK